MTSCLIELSKNIYNFEPLRVEGGEYTAKGTKNESIYFNICEPTKTTCPDAEVVSYANMVNENNTCLHMSGQNAYNQEVYPIDEQHPEYGVRMTFTGGA